MIESNVNPIYSFLDSFTRASLGKYNLLTAGYVDLYGKELLVYFKQWKEERNMKLEDYIDEAKLIKKIKLEMNLPEHAITKSVRTSQGQKQRYDLRVLRSYFEIPTEEILEELSPDYAKHLEYVKPLPFDLEKCEGSAPDKIRHMQNQCKEYFRKFIEENY